MRRKQGMGARSSSDARWSGIWCVCAAFGVLGPVSAQAQVYTTIDLGGYIGTRANSINDQGVITGVYGCGGSVVGSYMRAADGTITTFSAFPCSGEQVNETEAASINNGGVITGNTVHGVTGEGFRAQCRRQSQFVCCFSAVYQAERDECREHQQFRLGDGMGYTW